MATIAVASMATPAIQVLCQKPATIPTKKKAFATGFVTLTSTDSVECRLKTSCWPTSRRAASRRGRGRHPLPPLRDEGGAPRRDSRGGTRALPRTVDRGAARGRCLRRARASARADGAATAREPRLPRRHRVTPARRAAAGRRARTSSTADPAARRESTGPGHASRRPRTGGRPGARVGARSGDETTGELSPELWRRYLALALDGLRAQAARPLPYPPPTSGGARSCDG